MTRKKQQAGALAGVILLAVTGGITVAAADSPARGGTTRAAQRGALTFRRPGEVAGCEMRNLVAGLHGAQMGLGNRGFILTLTNTSSGSCSLDGYPGLGLENAAHKQLTERTLHTSTYFDRDPGRSAIMLSPGENASADVSFSSGEGPASSAAATYLEIRPPDARLHFTVKIPDAPVHIFSGTLHVTALARHTPY